MTDNYLSSRSSTGKMRKNLMQSSMHHQEGQDEQDTRDDSNMGPFDESADKFD